LKGLLEKHENILNILPEFLENITAIHEDITKLQVSLFKNPFCEIVWLFTKVTGQENIGRISHILFTYCILLSRRRTFFIGGS
jgi:hypothetical protein